MMTLTIGISKEAYPKNITSKGFAFTDNFHNAYLKQVETTIRRAYPDAQVAVFTRKGSTKVTSDDSDLAAEATEFLDAFFAKHLAKTDPQVNAA